jgi:hypothetical protein
LLDGFILHVLALRRDAREFEFTEEIVVLRPSTSTVVLRLINVVTTLHAVSIPSDIQENNILGLL